MFSRLCTGCGLPIGLDICGSGSRGWLPQLVFSLGNGLSSVEAWFSTALDLSGTGGDQLHVMRLGLPDWFRRTYLSFLSRFRVRFKLGVEMVVFPRVVL